MSLILKQQITRLVRLHAIDEWDDDGEIITTFGEDKYEKKR